MKKGEGEVVKKGEGEVVKKGEGDALKTEITENEFLLKQMRKKEQEEALRNGTLLDLYHYRMDTKRSGRHKMLVFTRFSGVLRIHFHRPLVHVIQIDIRRFDMNDRLLQQAIRLDHVLREHVLVEEQLGQRLAQSDQRLQLTHRDAIRRLAAGSHRIVLTQLAVARHQQLLRLLGELYP